MGIPLKRSVAAFSKSRLARLSIFAIIGASALSQLAYIIHYGVNVPMWDDWAHIKFIQAFYTQSLNVRDLFEQYGEYRPFLSRVIIIVIALTTEYNIIAQLIVSWILRVATFGIIFHFYKENFGASNISLARFLPIALLFFSLSQSESFLKADIIVYHLSIFGVVLTLFFLSRLPRRKNLFGVALITALLTSLTFFSGLILWVVGLLYILYLPIEKKLKSVVWLLCGSVVWIAYFAYWIPPPHTPPLQFYIPHLGDIFKFFIVLLGSILTMHQGLTLILGIAIAVCIPTVLWLTHNKGTYAKSLPWIAMLTFFLLMTAFIAMIRVKIDFAPRYVSFTIFPIICLYILVLLILQNKKIGAALLLQYFFICIITISGLFGYSSGITIGRAMKIEAQEVVGILKKYPYIPADKWQIPAMQFVRRDTLPFLFEHNLSFTQDRHK